MLRIRVTRLPSGYQLAQLVLRDLRAKSILLPFLEQYVTKQRSAVFRPKSPCPGSRKVFYGPIISTPTVLVLVYYLPVSFITSRVTANQNVNKSPPIIWKRKALFYQQKQHRSQILQHCMKYVNCKSNLIRTSHFVNINSWVRWWIRSTINRYLCVFNNFILYKECRI